MELKVQVKKKSFKAQDGTEREYYELSTEFGGETFRLKVDDKDKKLFNHMLNKCDIPLEAEDTKEVLMRKLLSGESLSAEEKALLQGLLDVD